MISRTSRKQGGFTLVEFLIGNLMVMVILTATFTLLHSIFTANTTMQQVLNTEQNLRVAMNAITRDITMAGTGLTDSGVPIPSSTNAVGLVRQGLGLPCANPYTGPGCLPTPGGVLSILSPGNSVGPTVANTATDVLTIAMVDQNSPTWTASTITADGITINFTPEIRSGSGQMFVGDLLLFNNAEGVAFGCVKTVSTIASQATFAAADLLNINQPTAAAGTITQNLRNTGSNPATYPPTSATRVMLITYYLDNSNTANPKLMRVVNGNTAQVMVEGIENLQFSFDIFDYVNDSGTANVPAPANFNQIRSVRVEVSGRSTDKLKGKNDYYHFGMASKVNVRNATFRNRYS